MRYMTIMACCCIGTMAHTEIVPAIPTEAEQLVSGTCFHSELPDAFIYCEVYEEKVGDTLYFWERIRLRSTNRIIRISGWEQFEKQEVLFEAEGFFTNQWASP
jgi:hypothetical protein